MNTQPIEKLEPLSPTLDVHSMFYTIQGEGPFAGRPAVFIRLAGCNLQCPDCDTEYTDGRQTVVVAKVAMQALELHAAGAIGNKNPPLVVITGGEPFRQSLYSLCQLLTMSGVIVQIETNGTLPPRTPSNHADFGRLVRRARQSGPQVGMPGVYIVCSPKTASVHKDLQPLVYAYKYVATFGFMSDIDGLPTMALGNACGERLARPHKGFEGLVYLQPADQGNIAKNSRNLADCTASALKFGHTVQVQLHKLLGVQ